MSSVRLRRLQADFEKLSAYAQRHPRVRLVQVEGKPPEKYQVEFQLRSVHQKDDQLTYVDRHLVEISIPRNYPRMPPQCRMLTPVFHPNIAPHAICIGDHWNAGEPLWSMVMRIGEMLAYQSYNTKSPLNGEAARWVAENEASLPLDPVPLYVDQPEQKPAAPASSVPTAKVVGSKPPVAAPPLPQKPLPQKGVATARVVKKAPAAKPPAPGEVPAARVVKKAPPPPPAAPTQPKPATDVPTARVMKKPPTPAVSPPPKPQADVPTARVVKKSPAPPAAKPQPGTPEPGAGIIACVCPGCQAAYDVPAVMAGKNARCKKCRTIISIPSH